MFLLPAYHSNDALFFFPQKYYEHSVFWNFRLLNGNLSIEYEYRILLFSCVSIFQRCNFSDIWSRAPHICVHVNILALRLLFHVITSYIEIAISSTKDSLLSRTLNSFIMDSSESRFIRNVGRQLTLKIRVSSILLVLFIIFIVVMAAILPVVWLFSNF